ncbi:hypothetical protein V8D89_014701 [Ganoderma adspersum]
MSAPPIRGSLQLHIRQKAPRRPPSPSRTRRPRSDTDEEEERPKKKRQKRPLQNPDSQKVILSANQRENATHQRHSGRASFSSAAASGSHRQEPSEVPVTSRGNRRASTPAIPPPHEVIEILDSDEELPPPPPQLEIKPEPKSGKELPRRKFKPGLSKPGPAKPGYREDPDGAIVLDSSDDDDPPARTSTAKENSTSVQEKELSPEQRQVPSAAPSSPLLECKPSPPTSPNAMHHHRLRQPLHWKTLICLKTLR